MKVAESNHCTCLMAAKTNRQQTQKKIADSVSSTQTELNFGVVVVEIDPQHTF